MRTLMVGLLVVGLLVVSPPAMAQQMDPLGLIASGAIVPFLGAGTSPISPGSVSFLEVYSPVGDNSSLHMFVFDPTCLRGPTSIALPLTEDDIALFDISNSDPGKNPNDGLVTIAGTPDGFQLNPLANPIHARVLWVNSAQDFVRVLDPIGIEHAEFSGSILGLPVNALGQTLGQWNPLRSAATFFAPLEAPASSAAGIHTTLYFVCPTQQILGATNANNSTASGAFPTSRFPTIVPLPVVSGTSSLRARIFDDDENFLVDVTLTCRCLSATPVTGISTIYANAVRAPDGTYTEIEGRSVTTTTNFCNNQLVQAPLTRVVPR